MSDHHPELDGDPHDDRPVHGERRRRALRITVFIALGALVLPLALSAYSVAYSAASRACSVYVANFSAGSDYRVSLEFFGDGGPGWQCFAVSASGVATPLANLGLLPAAPRPALPDERDT
ncbi:hypothetical protein [Agromyces ramosus]|uniref:Uncharacterized protein n=1 Tax=Agromyces ramosus TaxID=33879 RepID=A0ABU0R7E3_9MICO|nr:hypothetical protein [Agromyces ramosus]MDQ0892944.1 hypothetical protein [Agromyces ramosus]